MLRRHLFAWLAAAVALHLAAVIASADVKVIVVQSTTSTEQSGLFGHTLPTFKEKTGIEVRVVAVGTGKAIRNAMNGDGDVLLVHAKPDAEKFVAAGTGVKRFDVMYNDFVLIGPKKDPARLAGTRDVATALRAIAEARKTQTGPAGYHCRAMARGTRARNQ